MVISQGSTGTKRTEVLILHIHQAVDVQAEVLDLAQFLDLLCCEEELGEVPEVLADSPEDLAGIDVTLVPLQELLGCSHVLGNGLLGQDMLAS
jgi:hypothetical protein